MQAHSLTSTLFEQRNKHPDEHEQETAKWFPGGRDILLPGEQDESQVGGHEVSPDA